MTTEEQKQALRRQARADERALTDAYRASSSAAICRILTEQSAFSAADSVLAFVGTEREVDTSAFLISVLAAGKTLCLPRCTAEHTLALHAVSSLSDLSVGAYGIFEPTERCPTVSPGQIDLAVIPCLSFDRFGTRLGQGGGYYDRLLPRLRCPSFLVCRSALVRETLPREAHDALCTFLVTENGVFSPQRE